MKPRYAAHFSLTSSGSLYLPRWLRPLAPLLIPLLVASPAGCGRAVPVVHLPGHLQPYVVAGSRLANEPLASVLGRLREPFTTLPDRDARYTLSRYLATLARVGPGSRPELFSQVTDRLAYLTNAHLAWAVALHDRGGLAPDSSSAVRTVRFPLDGTTATLTELERAILALAPQEPRLGLCLNPGFTGGPPLPAAPLEGHALDWQLRDHAVRCGRSPGFWQLDAARRRLAVTEFTEYLPGLPVDRQARMQRLLLLVPPPAELSERIERACGASLNACELALLPLT